MGLFEEISDGLTKKLFGGGDRNKLLESVLGMINDPNTGGLSGLMQRFTDKGLGDVIGSWVSTRANLPVTADQLKEVLGSDQLQQIATHAGVSQEEASNGLAGLLPEIVDKLTPDGNVPESDMLAKGLDMLKSKLFSGS